MNLAKTLFKIIDVICYPMQNYISIDDVEGERNLVYGDDPMHKYDLYWKQTDAVMPVLVNVHGGGFVMGDKDCRDSISEMFADRGYIVVNANYRLAPKHPFPANILDILNLLNKLPALLGERFPNADFGRVVVTGDSAGAYTAAAVCAAYTDAIYRERLSLPEITNVKLAGFIGFCGPYDLPASLQSGLPFSILNSIGGSYLNFKFEKGFTNLKDYPFLKEISPANFVNANWPKTMLTYAEKDVFCKGQGQILYKKLQECGVPVIERHSTKFMDNHCYHFNFWTAVSKEAMKTAYEFLDEIRDNVPVAPALAPVAEESAETEEVAYTEEYAEVVATEPEAVEAVEAMEEVYEEEALAIAEMSETAEELEIVDVYGAVEELEPVNAPVIVEEISDEEEEEAEDIEGAEIEATEEIEAVEDFEDEEF